MPFVRSIVAQWQPRNCDPMVDFLDSWAPLIPVWVLDNILEQLIFPKLQKEVGPRGGGVRARAALICSGCHVSPSLFLKAPFVGHSFTWFP